MCVIFPVYFCCICRYILKTQIKIYKNITFSCLLIDTLLTTQRKRAHVDIMYNKLTNLLTAREEGTKWTNEGVYAITGKM